MISDEKIKTSVVDFLLAICWNKLGHFKNQSLSHSQSVGQERTQAAVQPRLAVTVQRETNRSQRRQTGVTVHQHSWDTPVRAVSSPCKMVT